MHDDRARAAPSSALPQLAADDALGSMALSFLRRKLMEEEAAKRRVEEAKKKEAQEAADLELAKRDPWWAQLCSSSSWCSTGAALGQGCRARCVHDKCPDPDA